VAYSHIQAAEPQQHMGYLQANYLLAMREF